MRLAALLLILSSFAVATGEQAAGHFQRHKRFEDIYQKKGFQEKVIRHDRFRIRQTEWVINVTDPLKVFNGTYLIAERSFYFHSAQLKWTKRELAETKKSILRTQCSGVYVPGVPCDVVQAFLCIHRGEGAWNANTGNSYYGGLQMDYGFQQTYGRELLKSKGTADHWTPAEQIQVANKAKISGRGYYPWPNTARQCGLI